MVDVWAKVFFFIAVGLGDNGCQWGILAGRGEFFSLYVCVDGGQRDMVAL